MIGHPMKICCECFMSVLLLNQEVWKEENDLTCHIFFMRTSSLWSMASWSRHRVSKLPLNPGSKMPPTYILSCHTFQWTCSFSSQCHYIEFDLWAFHKKVYICSYMINRRPWLLFPLLYLNSWVNVSDGLCWSVSSFFHFSLSLLPFILLSFLIFIISFRWRRQEGKWLEKLVRNDPETLI